MSKHQVVLLFLLGAVACGTPEPPAGTAVAQAGLTAARGRIVALHGPTAPRTTPMRAALSVKALAELPVASGQEATLYMRSFTTDDGLPVDDILCSIPDSTGALWFGTNGGGLTRYDGHGFTNFTITDGLPDNVILALGTDRAGNLWIGTSTGGLCKYDGRSFTNVDLNDATGLTRGITGIEQARDGSLWFATRGRGLYRIQGRHTEHYARADGLGSDNIICMAQGSDGSLWLATDSGLARMAGGVFTTWRELDGTDLTTVRALVGMRNGPVWLGHRSGGISRCTLVAGGQASCLHEPLIAGEAIGVTGLAEDKQGALWIGTERHGAFRMTEDKGGLRRFTRYTAAQGLASDELLCLTMDRHGNTWFGTRGAGIGQYRGAAFTNYKGLKPISLAEEGQGRLLVGTTSGMLRLDGNFKQLGRWGTNVRWNYAVSSDPQGRACSAVNMADPEQSGFSTLDGDHWRVQPGEGPYVDVFWSMHDRRGRLWLAGRNGVERYGNGLRTTWTTAQGLGNDNVLCLLEAADGSMWCGTDGGGISRIDSATVTTWNMESGMPNNVAWSIRQDGGGNLWIATLGGLCRYGGHSFLTFTRRNGMPDDNINEVLLTRDGQLCAGTLNGLALLTGWRDPSGAELPFNGKLLNASNDSLQYHAPVIDVYNTAAGYPIKDVQTAENSMFEDRQGVIWITTGSDRTGLVRFDRRALIKDTMPLELQLSQVTVDNENVGWYAISQAFQDSALLAQQEIRAFGRRLTVAERAEHRSRWGDIRFTGIRKGSPVPEGLELPYRHNHVGFGFAGIETTRPEGVRYQYMLEGYDRQWSAPVADNGVEYGNIHEGDYTFLLKARSPDGIWSTPLEYRFKVLPPWHRTWWAYGLYALVIGGGILGYVRLRLATLKRQRRKLAQLVEVRTEELSRQKVEADGQRHRAEQSEKAKERFLANMSHEIRTPMNAIMGMSDILRHREHSPEQAKYLHAIAQSSENLLVIINDILDLTKIDAGRVDFEQLPFRPREVLANVQEILRFKAEEKGLALVVEVAGAVPETLIGDPVRLNQVVMNLVGNAVKFTERGSVIIRAGIGPGPQARAGHVALMVAVSDTGIGIPADRMGAIFEEFTQAYSETTRKYGGTGLGLTISRRVAQLQGGTVTVESERGAGSTFTVTIPYEVG